jgi:ankyrin repeat protein
MNMFMTKSRTQPKDEVMMNNSMMAAHSQQFEAPVTLARLISTQSWNDVVSLISSRPVESIQIDDRMAITQDNILHFACRFHAPLAIIRLLSSKYPKSLVTPDSLGRFAIHVASKYGASPLVIHFLICENFAAASVPDDAGKTPIHYVGQYYARNHSTSASLKDVSENMLQVVRLFKAAAPESFNLEDLDEYNAIEYALESNADIKVVKAMQRAARDDWRELRKKHGVMSHEELARGLERNASEARRVLLSSIDEDVQMQPVDKQGFTSGAHVADQSVPQTTRSYVAKTA